MVRSAISRHAPYAQYGHLCEPRQGVFGEAFQSKRYGRTSNLEPMRQSRPNDGLRLGHSLGNGLQIVFLGDRNHCVSGLFRLAGVVFLTMHLRVIFKRFQVRNDLGRPAQLGWQALFNYSCQPVRFANRRQVREQ
jgi:hypothetical protein